MLEPEAATGIGIVGGVADHVLLLGVDGLLVPVLRLLVLLESVVLLAGDCSAVAVLAVGAAGSSRSAVGTVAAVGAGLLDLGDDRRERSRQRVDLMLGELGT